MLYKLSVNSKTSLKDTVKGTVRQKWKFCHHLLTHKLFQTMF